MTKYEDECVGCAEVMGCAGPTCPLRSVKHVYCDVCGEEPERLYVYEGQELCAECLINTLVIEGIVDERRG